jgi:cell division protein FtsB
MPRLTNAQKQQQQEQKQTMTRKRLLLTIGLTVAVGIFVFFSQYGVVTSIGLSSDTTDLSMQLVRQRTVSDSLRSVIRILETDTTEIERLARERYGYVREGEEVFVIKTDSAQ